MIKKTDKKKTNNLKIASAPILLVLAFLILVEFALLFSLVFLLTPDVFAGVGQSVNVTTTLQVGNVYPEIVSVNIGGGITNLDLTANSTKLLTIEVIAKDYNGEGDINNTYAEIFDMAASSYGAADDNNNHYTNASCSMSTGYGDAYEINATCTFNIWYYANNASWNVTVRVNDSYNLADSSSSVITINSLLSLGLPNSINYGLVNATNVSSEVIANVTNFGNVPINLSLSGYGVTPGDNLSMNCTLGSIKNISIGYEKYNLTSSISGALSLVQFEGNYSNLTSSSVIKKFNLNSRQNDTYNEAVNGTYWRIYVPRGVAGNCTGNIVFGAVQSAGS